MSWTDLLRVLGALAVLLPLAYVTARLVGSRAVIRPARAMRVVDALALGPGRALYLVEVGERMLVVGVSGQHMDRLAVITDPEQVQSLRRLAGAGRPGIPAPPWGRRRREAEDAGSTHGAPRGFD